MFSKILVGVDGQSGGSDAIALAGQLVAGDPRMLLAHVHPGGERFAKSAFDGDFEIGQHAESLKLLERERNAAGSDAETITIGSPSASAGLHRLAEECHADLLVLGSTSHRRLGRITRDHTRASLGDAPCAVAIAPSGYAARARPLLVVGVAYDGSPESEDALSLARGLVHDRHASIRAMSVVDLPSLAPTPSETDAQLRAVLAAAQRRLDELDGVHGEAVYGHVGPALTQWSASLDLLVVGSRGHGPAGRLVFGSTSLYLARHAHCPLLVLATGSSEARLSAGRQIGPESLTRAGSDLVGAVR